MSKNPIIQFDEEGYQLVSAKDQEVERQYAHLQDLLAAKRERLAREKAEGYARIQARLEAIRKS